MCLAYAFLVLNIKETGTIAMSIYIPGELNIEYLGRLFDNTSECYKFFWFKAILSKVCEGKTELSYETLVDEMIADAWYMVTEYHLNLGPKDTLEAIVNEIKEKNPSLTSSMEKSKLLKVIKDIEDKDIIKKKRTLTNCVPYRLQAPFMVDVKGDVWRKGERNLIEEINKEKRLIYYFSEFNGLSTVITVDKDWVEFIKDNQEIIRGWLKYNMIQYLQRRNPAVPGIADKLEPPQSRKLNDIITYWRMILAVQPVREIYSDTLLTAGDISIDHFVPWSYVAHDELWNLSPTTQSINSSKSNNLPNWDTYFNKLVKLEYQSYKLIWEKDMIHKEFEKVAKNHVNSDDVWYRLYRENVELNEFAGELQTVLLPVYKSAERCGFRDWIYKV